tara:strand:+ start:472 stop:816 length:345 start_codon:yes stop_codon:yes gene_type:complete
MTLYADKQNKKRSQSFPYVEPPGGHQDTGQVEKDEKGLFIVNIPEFRQGDSSDTLRIPSGTMNPAYKGGGPIKPGQDLDEDTYASLTSIGQFDETSQLSKKGKKFHRKYNKQNK